MNREEVKNFLLSNFDKIDGMIRQRLYFRYPEVFKAIYDHTNYLGNRKFVERLYHIMNDLYEIPKCKYCGTKPVKLNYYDGELKYSDFCSTKCMANSNETKNKRYDTNLKRYGSELYAKTNKFREKYKNTCINKYGVESHNQSNDVKNKKSKSYLNNYGVDNPSKSDDIKKKKENAYLKNYGVTSPLKNFEVKNRFIETCNEKYGVTNPAKLQEVQETKRKNCLDKYGVDHYTKTEEFKENIKSKFLDNKFYNFLNYRGIDLYDNKYISYRYYHNWVCLECNNIFNTTWEQITLGYLCPKCYPRTSSSFEREIKEILEKEYNYEIIMNDRSLIYPYEIDMLFPEHNLAVEFDGLYWHSFIEDKYYHLRKTNLCEEKGYKLLHIFEDEYIFRKNIVLEKLRYELGINNNKQKIYARNCEVKEINSKIKNEFLENNHIQGSDRSKVKIGAYYKDKLVSVMTFSKSNISRSFYQEEGVWELSRFATDVNFVIPGVASKLLEYFKNNYEWKEIFTYADKRWSNGNLYEKIGFNFSHETKPNYWYVVGNSRKHRFNLRKGKNDPKDIPEHIIRQSQGYRMIWDCGNIKFYMNNLRS